MRILPALRPLLAALFISLGALALAEDARIEEIKVRVSAAPLESSNFLAGYSRIGSDTLERVRATHPNELFVRVPGVWISRGSGQEHLTALRSGVLTGAGACGSILLLEDGIPIRPHGFCNVNNLFETTLGLSGGVEVLRGPAVATFRGNPLYGAINVLSPQATDPLLLELEAGSEAHRSLKAAGQARLGEHALQAMARFTATDGFRDSVNHREQKLKVLDRVRIGNWRSMTSLTLTNLDQQTGGYVLGNNAYKSSELKSTNPNPEAYREAWSARLISHWQLDTGTGSHLILAPYARASDMAFLQHFLPGQPIESNGQTSFGAIAQYRRHYGGHYGGLEMSIEGHIERAEIWLEEVQDAPTSGSAFLIETRPAGRHYDYDVSTLLASLSGRLVKSVNQHLELETGLRIERLAYDYNNKWLTGNTRDDGSACGFGGCLYTRPASREDQFTDIGGMLGMRYAFSDSADIWLGAASGFRAPQSTELYRLQRGQLLAELDSERRQSIELGLAWRGKRADLSTSLYAARSTNLVFRDAQGRNISQGKTKSVGIELDARLEAHALGTLQLVASWARHQYDFDQALGGGEIITSGNDVDTAPRLMGSGHWRKSWTQRLSSELEAVYLGEYWMNARNSHEYGGHLLLNLRLDWQLGTRTRVFARITNLLDRDYAHRADYAFGNERYFPGLPRQLHVGIRIDT